MLEFIDQLLHSLIARLRRELVQHIVVDTGRLDCRLRQREETCLFNSLVREDCNLFGTVCLQNFRNLLHRIFAAVNSMR